MTAPKIRVTINKLKSASDASPFDLAIGAVTTTPLQAIDPTEDNRYSTFTLFPKLPLELRRKTWVESFPDPRFVDLMLYEDLHDPNVDAETVESTRKLANNRAADSFPVTLSVNQESRKETLHHYVFVPIRGIKVIPYFLNPDKDFAYLRCLSLNPSREFTWKKSFWLSQLDKAAATNCLSKLDEAVFRSNTFLLRAEVSSRILRYYEEYH
ncbi:hypothetical protein DL98DRAFT_588785 [Cadophora sp. DSE1049]|nr:hypothetical protein DL98DRAFT_588785 [Cadophora sp. DSE1049]